MEDDFEEVCQVLIDEGADVNHLTNTKEGWFKVREIFGCCPFLLFAWLLCVDFDISLEAIQSISAFLPLPWYSKRDNYFFYLHTMNHMTMSCILLQLVLRIAVAYITDEQ